MNHKIILSMQASTCVYDFSWMWNSPVKVTSASCLEWHPDLWWGPDRITISLFVLLPTTELCLQPHDCLHLCAHTGWPWVSTLDGGLHMGNPWTSSVLEITEKRFPVSKCSLYQLLSLGITGWLTLPPVNLLRTALMLSLLSTTDHVVLVCYFARALSCITRVHILSLQPRFKFLTDGENDLLL